MVTTIAYTQLYVFEQLRRVKLVYADIDLNKGGSGFGFMVLWL